MLRNTISNLAVTLHTGRTYSRYPRYIMYQIDSVSRRNAREQFIVHRSDRITAFPKLLVMSKLLAASGNFLTCVNCVKIEHRNCQNDRSVRFRYVPEAEENCIYAAPDLRVIIGRDSAKHAGNRERALRSRCDTTPGG